MKGDKPAIVTDKKAVSSVPKVPPWLSPDAKKEWRRVMPPLVDRRILTEADLGSLEHYCVACGRIREIERLIQAGGAAIDPATFRMQDKAMTTARQLAAELGLTPVSRSRPAVRDDNSEDDDENPLNFS
jgi:P27 family predicted phage terminase small subunit